MNKIDIKNLVSDDELVMRFKKMSPEKKLQISLQLYYSAWELKKAAIKSKHPDWNENRIEDEVKKIFLYART